MDFDYFYNREAERFNFLKVPEILVDGEEFKGLSAEAIILYSMLLKRTGMSFKNKWIDKEGRVFIYFTVEEIMRRRNISKPTAIKTLDELDRKKGIGLIERVRLGLGKPNVIYVKDFMSIIAVKENDFQKSKNLTSEVKDFNLRSKENELQEVQNVDSNYIENNKSKYSKREYSFGENGIGTFQNVFLKDEDIGEDYQPIFKVPERHIKTIKQQFFLGFIKIREVRKKPIFLHGRNITKEYIYE